MTVQRLLTEHATEVLTWYSAEWVNVSITQERPDDDDPHTIISLTPEEARRLGDTLLTASQVVADNQGGDIHV